MPCTPSSTTARQAPARDELSERARAATTRPLHLLLENEDNEPSPPHPQRPARRSTTRRTVERRHPPRAARRRHRASDTGYYADYAGDTDGLLAKALAEGFAYQGQMMPYRGSRARRAVPATLPPGAFVAFIQNHDQIGNRAFGDRLGQHRQARRRCARWRRPTCCCRRRPMIFMGEEWGATQPFPFFCDFEGDLADAVREGTRVRSSPAFPEFQDPEQRDRIPTRWPKAPSTPPSSTGVPRPRRVSPTTAS